MKNLVELPIVDTLGLLILVVTIVAFLVLNRGIYVTKAKGQNFFSWLLWSILDGVLYIMIKEKDGISTILVFACVIGSFFTSVHLFFYKKNWTWDESRTLFFIFFLFILMIFSNSPRNMIIFGVIAEMIAGWPLLKETWKNPDDSGYTLLSYLIFFLGYVLTICKNFVELPFNEVFGERFVENMLFPLSFITYSFFDTIPLVRKWLCRG